MSKFSGTVHLLLNDQEQILKELKDIEKNFDTQINDIEKKLTTQKNDNKDDLKVKEDLIEYKGFFIKEKSQALSEIKSKIDNYKNLDNSFLTDIDIIKNSLEKLENAMIQLLEKETLSKNSAKPTDEEIKRWNALNAIDWLDLKKILTPVLETKKH